MIQMNPWRPMRDPLDLKHLGKLSEELGEAQAAVARCIIQGIDEVEPVTGKPNRVWLEEEFADVLANIYLVATRFNLSEPFIEARTERKMAQLAEWHAMAGDAPTLPADEDWHRPQLTGGNAEG